MNWAEILGNVAGGGLLGLLGTTVSFALGFWQRKQEHAQRLEWAKEERLLTQARAQADAARTAGEVAVARESGAATAFTASQQAEMSIGVTYPWVNAVRALVRPALTLLLILITTCLYFFSTEEVRSYISQNIVVTTVAAVTWWFGQRQLDRSSLNWGNATASAAVSSSINR